jgi:hypothetical protein
LVKKKGVVTLTDVVEDGPKAIETDSEDIAKLEFGSWPKKVAIKASGAVGMFILSTNAPADNTTFFFTIIVVGQQERYVEKGQDGWKGTSNYVAECSFFLSKEIHVDNGSRVVGKTCLQNPGRRSK